jgi:hypothetical protein
MRKTRAETRCVNAPEEDNYVVIEFYVNIKFKALVKLTFSL